MRKIVKELVDLNKELAALDAAYARVRHGNTKQRKREQAMRGSDWKQSGGIEVATTAIANKWKLKT